MRLGAWSNRPMYRQYMRTAPISVEIRPERPFNREWHAKVVKRRLVHAIHKASKVLSIRHMFPRGPAPKLPATQFVARAIVDLVCEATGQTKDILDSARRTSAIVEARFCCYYLLYKHTAMSLPEIGKFLGGKDHASVINGRDKVTANPELFSHITGPVERVLGLV